MPKFVDAQVAKEIISSVKYVLLDVDGVLWRGANIIDHVPETLQYLRAQGKKIRFMTNNASLSRRGLQDMFARRGIPGVTVDEVYNSAFASALKLRELLGKPVSHAEHRNVLIAAENAESAQHTNTAEIDKSNKPATTTTTNSNNDDTSDYKVHGNVFVIGEQGLHDEIQSVLAPGYFTYGTELHDMTSLGGYNAVRVASAWHEKVLPYPHKCLASANGEDDDEAMWGGGGSMMTMTGNQSVLYNRHNEPQSIATSVGNDNHNTVNKNDSKSKNNSDSTNRDVNPDGSAANNNDSENTIDDNNSSRSRKISSVKSNYSHVESEFSMCNHPARGISLTELNPVAVVVGLDLHFNILKMSYAAMILQGPPSCRTHVLESGHPQEQDKQVDRLRSHDKAHPNTDSSSTSSMSAPRTSHLGAGAAMRDTTHSSARSASTHTTSRALFIATNEDAQIPIGQDGILFPGAGVMVNSLQITSNRTPDAVCGKPCADMAITLFAAEGIKEPSSSCLMVGDRLTTDVAFGYRAGCARMFVLSGVEKQEDVDAAERMGVAELIPDYIADSLATLLPQDK